jgi:hypothetical protein
MLRNLVRLAVVLLIGHALYRFVPVYLHNYQFKDAIEEAALYSKDRPESEILDRVMTLAARYHIPLNPEEVQVTRDQQMTYINVFYEEQIEWLPGYRRPMPFTISVEGWHVRAPTRVDPLR